MANATAENAKAMEERLVEGSRWREIGGERGGGHSRECGEGHGGYS